MTIVLSILALLILLAGGNIFRQNSKPQVPIGLVNGKFQEISSKPNCVSTQTAYDDKRVEPLAFKDSLEASKAAIKKAFDSYGDIEIKEETDTYIYAVATTGTMKYHDDIEICLDQEAGVVHFRSASRAGYSDMGLNKTRFDAISKVYNEQ